jgi:hypothetical protein
MLLLGSSCASGRGCLGRGGWTVGTDVDDALLGRRAVGGVERGAVVGGGEGALDWKRLTRSLTLRPVGGGPIL